MDHRTYRPELPPNTIYRPLTLLERLCRDTPPPEPAVQRIAIGKSASETRDNLIAALEPTEALTVHEMHEGEFIYAHREDCGGFCDYACNGPDGDRQPTTEALPVCLAPETGEPLPPIDDHHADAGERGRVEIIG